MRRLRTHRLLAALFLGTAAFAVISAEPVPIKAPVPAPAKDAGPADEKEVRALLKEKVKFAVDGEALTVKDILQLLSKEHHLAVRMDLAAFKRFRTFENGAGAAMAAGMGNVFVALRADIQIDDIQQIYEVKVRVNIVAGYTLADLLTDFCAQLPGKCSYRIRHNQILIGPAFLPPVVPGAGINSGDVMLMVPQNVLAEQILGESISIAIEDKPLTEAIQELRKITGANIVLDARSKDKAKQVVSGTFDDARLLTALELLADMCDLKVVSNKNVFYITAPENAAKMQKQINRDLFGEPFPPQNLGGLTPSPIPMIGKDEPKK